MVLNVFPPIFPAGASENRLGSSERIWKHKNTVSMGRPLSSAGTRTLV